MAGIGDILGSGPAETFLGVPAAMAATGARAAILGVPMASPYPAAGAYSAAAPRAIRAAAAPWAGSQDHVNFDFGRPGWDAGAVVDLGDLALAAADASGNRVKIRHAVAEVLAAGAVPAVLGGDDSVVIPLLQGFEGNGPLTVLQIDAHIDWREQIEGERWGLSSAMRRASEMGHVARIVQVGARGLGSARRQDLADARAWGAEIIPAERIAREGIAAAIAAIPEGAAIHVALDCDALDPAIMPAVIAPTAGGLSYWDVIGLMRGAAGRGRVAGLSLVELVPDHDIGGRGALLAAQILTTALGIVAGED
jgi:agmatinase